MSDTDETSARRAGHAPSKTLSLKKTETSTVKQSFSHGRTKAVVVEKKRARVESGKPADKPRAKEAQAKTATPAPAAPAAPTAAQRAGVVLRQLTDEEKARRGAALADARVHEEEARKRAEEDAKRRAEEDGRLKRERAAAEKRKAEEDARKTAEQLARKHAEEEASRRLEKKEDPAGSAPAKAPAETPRRGRLVAEEEEETVSKKGAKAPAKVPAAKKGEDNRRRGKLTVAKALSGDDERMRSVASYRRHLLRAKGQQTQPAGPVGPREVTIPETITVAELANRMARRSVDVIKVLMKNGMMATVNDVIDADTAELVAAEYGHTVKRVAESDVLEGLKGTADEESNLKPRPPVVTVMGHVDHGKT